MRTRGALPIVALLVTFALASCSSPTARTVTPMPSSPAPTRIPLVTVDMFYVGDTPTGFKLFSEKYSFQTTGDVVSEALSRLITGRAKPADPDYENLWGTDTSLNAFTRDGTTGIIDLTMGKLNVGAEAESRAIDQLLWTASGIDPSITGILLLVDGKRIESLAGHVDATQTIMKQESYEVLNSLQISSFAEGDTLKNPVAISGEACTFEANLLWTLRKGDEVIRSAPATAAAACPDRSPWSVQLGNLSAGDYSFTVEDFSAKDGSLSSRDDKSFSVATR